MQVQWHGSPGQLGLRVTWFLIGSLGRWVTKCDPVPCLGGTRVTPFPTFFQRGTAFPTSGRPRGGSWLLWIWPSTLQWTKLTDEILFLFVPVYLALLNCLVLDLLFHFYMVVQPPQLMWWKHWLLVCCWLCDWIEGHLQGSSGCCTSIGKITFKDLTSLGASVEKLTYWTNIKSGSNMKSSNENVTVI